jgi:adenylate cyclase
MSLYEIERKFIVDTNLIKFEKNLSEGIQIKQGYIFDTEKGVLRVRQYGDKFILTIKLRTESLKQIEIEKQLTKDEFELLYSQCDSYIEKIRYKVGRWEIDKFEETANFPNGFIMAEIELVSEDEEIEIPRWAVKEVTGIKDFFNSSMAIKRSEK